MISEKRMGINIGIYSSDKILHFSILFYFIFFFVICKFSGFQFSFFQFALWILHGTSPRSPRSIKKCNFSPPARIIGRG